MPTWSKEDKISYDKSEVFQELEKLTIANIHRLDLLAKKAQTTNTLKSTTQAAKEATKALQDLGKASKEVLGVGMAEDQLSEQKDEDPLMLSGTSKALAESIMNETIDSEVSDTIINELMEMKEAAIKEGNTKLAYKIERTLDEILSVETV